MKYELVSDDDNGLFSECGLFDSEPEPKQRFKALPSHCRHCVKYCMVRHDAISDRNEANDLDDVCTVHDWNGCWLRKWSANLDVD